MKNKTVTIVMPCYNGEKYLPESISSVVEQTYQYWELIVVDDASTDKSASVVAGFAAKDQRIKYFRQQENQGVAAARNRATKEASGRYLAFLDVDDVWAPKKLEEQISHMTRHGLPLCYGSYYIINNSSNKEAEYVAPKSITFKDLHKSNFIGNLTGIVDTELIEVPSFEKIGHEDYVFWLKLMSKVGKPISRPEGFIALYRKSESSLSGNKKKAAMWQWKIYRTILKLSFFKSAYFMCFYVFYGFTKFKKIKST